MDSLSNHSPHWKDLAFDMNFVFIFFFCRVCNAISINNTDLIKISCLQSSYSKSVHHLWWVVSYNSHKLHQTLCTDTFVAFKRFTISTACYIMFIWKIVGYVVIFWFMATAIGWRLSDLFWFCKVNTYADVRSVCHRKDIVTICRNSNPWLHMEGTIVPAV